MSKAPVRNLKILLACMPKSGSTFMAEVISSLPQMRRESLLPGAERREQEIDESRIVECLKRTAFLRKLHRQDELRTETRPLGWIAQHHTRYSRSTADLIEKHHIRPVVLVRNIFDVVPSLYDHVTRESPFMSMAYVEDLNTLDRDTFLDFIVEMAIPWYFNFFVSWTTNKNAPVVTYEDLINEPEQTIGNLMKRWNTEITHDDIVSALERARGADTRLNKGVSGRGQQLPDKLKAKIENYTKFYPSVDFTPIGL